MRLHKFVLFLFISLSAVGFAQTEQNHLKKANDFYSKEKWDSAIASYEKVLNAGKESADLYYNLGNAYFKNKLIGKAIWNYELALKFNPNHADAQNNMAIAKSTRIDKIENKQIQVISSFESSLGAIYNEKGWAFFTIALMFVMMLLFLLVIFGRRLVWRRMALVLSLITMVCFVAVYYIGNTVYKKLRSNNHAVLTAYTSYLMNAPSENAKQMLLLHEGTEFEVLEQNKEYTFVKMENGNEGWLKNNFLGFF
jgi:TPR repeat protein